MTVTPKLIDAQWVGEYRLHLRFADGVEGDVDLADELWGEVFEPLRDVAYFRRFTLDSELNTVRWPSGADLAPEFLYESAHAAASR